MEGVDGKYTIFPCLFDILPNCVVAFLRSYCVVQKIGLSTELFATVMTFSAA